MLNILNLNINYQFYIIISLIFITGIAIIIVKNPILAILNMILLFLLVAINLYFQNLAIMSLLYILIYIGAIAILFLFILSLLNVNMIELNMKSNYNKRDYLILVSVMIFILISIFKFNYIYDYSLKFNDEYIFYNYNIDVILSLFNNIFNNNNYQWMLSIYNYNNYIEINTFKVIGELFYTYNSIIFIILAIILLLSIIGSIVITMRLRINK